MNLLPWTIYISFAGALLALLLGNRSATAGRVVALGTALAALFVSLGAAADFTPVAAAGASQLQTLVNCKWLAFSNYHLAADGISLTLVVLTGIAAVAGILFSWNVKQRVGDFFALFLALIGGVYGVFLAADAFLLFVFYEIAIVPKYFLVAIWGSTNREYGAMKLVLFSFAGSALVLAGILWAGAAGVSYDMTRFALDARLLSGAQQTGMFALIFTGFAVLAGMFPFHTWAPTGHVAAPTGASMLLAGVVMKLGAYGCLRVALPAFPLGFETAQPIIAGLAIAGIIYAGLIALVQTDFKFVIGYSSVSHMGFVLLGLAAATPLALAGSVLQMFSHGVIAGLLFAVVGRMVYERTHTRDLRELSKLPLARLLPFAAFVFALAGVASMGFPGFSGFPAEVLILAGAWQTEPLWAIAAAVGIPVAVAFTLRAVVMAFWGKKQECGAAETAGNAAGTHAGTHDIEHHLTHEFITLPEKLGAALLLGASILVGLCPNLLLNWIRPALNSPAMQIVVKTTNATITGGAQ